MSRNSLITAYRTKRSRYRVGQTLLELVAATVIISTTIIPLLRLTRNGVVGNSRVEQTELCMSMCVSELESAMARTVNSWTMETLTGDYDSISRPLVKFSVTTSDAVADGGLPDSLAAIFVVVWQDNDDDDALDPEEPSVSLQTKISRSVSYSHL